MTDENKMISVWESKKYGDMIPFDRVICVNSYWDGVHHTDNSLCVELEGKIHITVNGEEIEDFKEAYRAFIQITEMVSLGLVPEETRRKK